MQQRTCREYYAECVPIAVPAGPMRPVWTQSTVLVRSRRFEGEPLRQRPSLCDTPCHILTRYPVLASSAECGMLCLAPLPGPEYDMLRNVVMILFVTCATLGGQLLLKHATMQLAGRVPALTGLRWLASAFQMPAIWAAIAIQGIGFVVWLVVISRMKLGLAFAFAGACLYLLMPAVSWWLYGERLLPLQWVGIALISIGVLMLSAVAAQG